MRFELEPHHKNVPDEELIQDIIETARKLGRNTITQREYTEHGKYHFSTLYRRFGSWFAVLEKAGLEMSRSKIGIPDQEVFDALRETWIALGRQPRAKEFKHAGLCEKRYGSWRKALQAFVEFINAETAEQDSKSSVDGEIPNQVARPVRRTKRDISERLRFSILLRDGFRCQSCGKSPVKSPGVELHVDHVTPWSRGGETVADNLQTKCKQCNLGKGNAFDQ